MHQTGLLRGCIPALALFAIPDAFYVVLTGIAELSKPGQLPIRALPLPAIANHVVWRYRTLGGTFFYYSGRLVAVGRRRNGHPTGTACVEGRYLRISVAFLAPRRSASRRLHGRWIVFLRGPGSVWRVSAEILRM
jgi:hypothetical protein